LCVITYVFYIHTIFQVFKPISNEKAVPSKKPVGVLRPAKRLAEEVGCNSVFVTASLKNVRDANHPK